MGIETALMAAGVGASLYGASKASKAAGQAADLQYQATQESLALQKQIYEDTVARNEPFRQYGLGAAGALAGGLGLMTGGSGYSGGSGYTATQSPQTDWNSYLQTNPDVLQWAQSGGGDPNKPIEQQSLQERAAYHYANSGQSEGRQVSMTQPTSGAQSGYFDPTAMMGYQTPQRVSMAPLNVGIDQFRASPDYEFRVQEGNKGLDHIASSQGGVYSGQRAKAAVRFNQDIADSEYTDWRDYTTATHQADRAFNESVYQTDRSRLDDRYDTRNSLLMQIAGFGTGANAQTQNAAQSFANQSTSLMTAGAQAQGEGKVNAANAWNQGINNLMTTGAYMYGQSQGGQRRETGVPAPSYAWNPMSGA